MIVTPKFLGQLVSLLATNTWPLGVQAGRATGDPFAFVGFHDVLAIYWYCIQYRGGRAKCERPHAGGLSRSRLVPCTDATTAGDPRVAGVAATRDPSVFVANLIASIARMQK